MSHGNKLEIDLELKSKNYFEQMDRAQEKIESLVDEYNKLIENAERVSRETGKAYAPNQEKLAQLRTEIEKTSNEYVRLSEAQKKMQQQSAKHWDINLKGLKRLALGIIGVSSLYGLASKASSAYLSKDTELAQKLQSVWVGLGSYLAPLLTKISDLMLKALGYINVFVTALTGVDYIARANAKALNKQAEAQTKLNKATQQYDFDVIRTQQEQVSGGASTSGLVNLPQLDVGIVKKLQDLAYWLKENETLVKGVGIALGITFGAIAVKNLLSNIGALLGKGGTATATGTGLAGLATTLLFLADVFVITLVAVGVKDTINQYKELMDVVKNNTTLIEDNQKSASKLADKYWELVESGKVTTEQTDIYAEHLKKTREDIIKQIDKLESQKSILGQLSPKNRELTKQQKALASQLNFTTAELGKLNEKGLIADTTYKDLEETLNRLTKNPHKVQVIIEEKYTSSGGSSSGGRHFATGGIVTQPTRAIIGEAGYPEAVVPMTADYLKTLASEIARYGSTSGNNITNVYLDGKLIQRQVSKVEKAKSFATNGG